MEHPVRTEILLRLGAFVFVGSVIHLLFYNIYCQSCSACIDPYTLLKINLQRKFVHYDKLQQYNIVTRNEHPQDLN